MNMARGYEENQVTKVWRKSVDKEELDDFQPLTTRRWWGKSKRRKMAKTPSFKQTINQTSSIISTNKSWKKFIQTKKLNILPSLSTQENYQKNLQQFNQVLIIMGKSKLIITSNPIFFNLIYLNILALTWKGNLFNEINVTP